MKAAVLSSPQKLCIQEIDTPKPGFGEVLVQVAFTGICGSDVPRVLDGAVHSYPMILGHEFSGRIVDLGEGVDQSLRGLRVAGVPLRPCMKCDSCKKGNFSLCSSYGFIGSRQNGSMAEYVCVPVQNIYPINDEVSDLEAAFFEPATVALHAIELMNYKPGSTVLVLGTGTIGCLLALALQDYQPGVVVAACRNSERFPSLEAAGLDCLVATNESSWKERALEYTDGLGFEYIFDAAGTPETIPRAFELAAPKGSVCFVGTPKSDVSFSVRQWECINRKELIVRGSWMSYSNPWPGVEWEKVCDLFSRGVITVTKEMIDSIYDLDNTVEAFRRIESGKVRGKVLVRS